MKFKIGDRLKGLETSKIDHDDCQILATFTSDDLNGYFYIHLYSNSIEAVSEEWEREVKFSQSSDDAEMLRNVFRSRFDDVVEQVKKHGLKNLEIQE